VPRCDAVATSTRPGVTRRPAIDARVATVHACTPGIAVTASDVVMAGPLLPATDP
jgi:hypothetical protein